MVVVAVFMLVCSIFHPSCIYLQIITFVHRFFSWTFFVLFVVCINQHVLSQKKNKKNYHLTIYLFIFSSSWGGTQQSSHASGLNTKTQDQLTTWRQRTKWHALACVLHQRSKEHSKLRAVCKRCRGQTFYNNLMEHRRSIMMLNEKKKNRDKGQWSMLRRSKPALTR